MGHVIMMVVMVIIIECSSTIVCIHVHCSKQSYCSDGLIILHNDVYVYTILKRFSYMI